MTIVGSTRQSNNCGDFLVLEEIKNTESNIRKFKIQFLKTKFETEISISNIYTGSVKDWYYPSVCNIGCRGDVNASKTPHTRRLHKLWNEIISRCYNSKNKNYCNYGGKGFTISDNWLIFSNFLNEYTHIEGWNLEKYENGELYLDKDVKEYYKEDPKKQYSLDTCSWVSCLKNNQYQSDNKNGDKYETLIGISPDNVIYKNITNFKGFAIEHGLNNNRMSDSIRYKIKTKGWIFLKDYDMELVEKVMTVEGEKYVFKGKNRRCHTLVYKDKKYISKRAIKELLKIGDNTLNKLIESGECEMLN